MTTVVNMVDLTILLTKNKGRINNRYNEIIVHRRKHNCICEADSRAQCWFTTNKLETCHPSSTSQRIKGDHWRMISVVIEADTDFCWGKCLTAKQLQQDIAGHLWWETRIVCYWKYFPSSLLTSTKHTLNMFSFLVHTYVCTHIRPVEKKFPQNV